jgi:hypothetical protein
MNINTLSGAIWGTKSINRRIPIQYFYYDPKVGLYSTRGRQPFPKEPTVSLPFIYLTQGRCPRTLLVSRSSRPLYCIIAARSPVYPRCTCFPQDKFVENPSARRAPGLR